MFSLLAQRLPLTNLSNRQLVLDASKLREDERLEFKYDYQKNLIAIQKIKLAVAAEPMEAIAQTDITPGFFGRVIYQGDSWKARSDGEQTIAKDQKVLVVAQHGLTLIVTPAA